MRFREKVVNPVLYRLGYLHYSNTIGGVLSGDADTIGATVDGYLVFPDDTKPEGVNIEFVGVVVDPQNDDEDEPSIYERVYAVIRDSGKAAGLVIGMKMDRENEL